MDDKKKKTSKLKRIPRVVKSKYIGYSIREWSTKGKNFKIGDSYDAIEKGSFEYLINAGYISAKKQ